MFWFREVHLPRECLVHLKCLHSPTGARLLELFALFIKVPHSCCLSHKASHQPFAGVFYSLLTEADAGHTEFTDEVFQNETRFPGGEWKPAAEPYTDVVWSTALNHMHMHACVHTYPQTHTHTVIYILVLYVRNHRSHSRCSRQLPVQIELSQTYCTLPAQEQKSNRQSKPLAAEHSLFI